MAGLFGEPNHLVFNRWAISWPNTLYVPAIHGRSLQILSHNLMGLLVRMSNPARYLGHCRLSVQEREHDRQIITILAFKARPVDRPTIQPWGRAGLQPATGRQKLPQSMRKRDRRRVANAPSRAAITPNMDHTVKESTRSQDNRSCTQYGATLQDNAANLARIDREVNYLGFHYRQMALL